MANPVLTFSIVLKTQGTLAGFLHIQARLLSQKYCTLNYNH